MVGTGHNQGIEPKLKNTKSEYIIWEEYTFKFIYQNKAIFKNKKD